MTWQDEPRIGMNLECGCFSISGGKYGDVRCAISLGIFDILQNMYIEL
jgi:hypothetical protein